jgi:hypothetical protein
VRKIPTLFERDHDDRDRLTRTVHPAATWVLDGEGVPTRKYDGTSCLVEDGVLWKRYMVKHGRKPPADFRATGEPDPITGKQAGWVRVGDGPEDQWHREALWYAGHHLEDGTYELVGPKVQGNPEEFLMHELIRHGEMQLFAVPRDFDGLRTYLLDRADMEGIVWHHPDGRMAKLKRRDVLKDPR